MNRSCAVCFYSLISLVGFFALLYGGLGALAVGLTGSIPGSGFPPVLPLTVGVILGFGGLFMAVSTVRKGSMMHKVVTVAGSFERINIDDISRQSGVKLPAVRPLLFEAIASGAIHGTVKENTFVRESPKAGEKMTVEREVMVTRKAPDVCLKCGAALNPKDVEWVGPDQVRCAHCGSVMSVETKRL